MSWETIVETATAFSAVPPKMFWPHHHGPTPRERGGGLVERDGVGVLNRQSFYERLYAKQHWLGRLCQFHKHSRIIHAQDRAIHENEQCFQYAHGAPCRGTQVLGNRHDEISGNGIGRGLYGRVLPGGRSVDMGQD